MYKYCVYNFDDEEINQICELVKLWSAGMSTPIDRRKYTKQVIRYAHTFKLVQTGVEIKQTYYGNKDRYVDIRYYPAHTNDFQPVYMPQEALWRLLENTLKNCTGGYSIVKDRIWYALGLQPDCGGTSFKPDIDGIWNILFQLSKWRYIKFQSAGSIWRIDVTEEKAIRSEP